jgi:hypothetical protein
MPLELLGYSGLGEGLKFQDEEKSWLVPKEDSELGIVVHTFNPSSWEAKA